MVTRVTNTMLTNQLLSNLSLNLNNMDRLQNQLANGRKYAHISDDPSALIYGQAARNKLARLSHYQKTVETAQSWLTQSEAGVMELQKVIGNVYEELVSAGSVKTVDDKKNLAMVVRQLQDHYVDTLNTAYGDRFVFAGYNTPGDFSKNPDLRPEIKPFQVVDNELYFNGHNISKYDGWDLADFEKEIEDDPVLKQLLGDLLHFDVGPGISMPVTINGIDMVMFTTKEPNGPDTIVRNTFDVLQEIYMAINSNPDEVSTDELTLMIKTLQDAQNHLLAKTAEIGGRQRRLELLEARYEQDNLNYETMRSDAEDVDMAEVIMYLKMAEAVYQAALSAGARVIQPSLMDFLR